MTEEEAMLKVLEELTPEELLGLPGMQDALLWHYKERINNYIKQTKDEDNS